MNVAPELASAARAAELTELYILAREAERAFSTKVEWLQEMILRPNGRLVRYVEHNYTEIFRGGSPVEVARRVWGAVQSQSRPFLDLTGTEPVAQMGGKRYYKVFPKDGEVTLFVLRDITRIGQFDWLCDLSVRVRP